MRPTYGVLLPHFGRHAERRRLLTAAQQAEHAGFDVLFARDHLYYQPRSLEIQDPDFLDTFVTLSAVAAVTQHALLGTAVINPHRHPIHTAQLFGSLDRVAGGGRLFTMWGLGAARSTDAAGMASWDKPEAFKEYIEIVRALWSGKKVDHDSPYYKFEGVSVSPVPEGQVPMWYGGTSLAAVRRAVEMFDGYSAGQMPGRDYLSRRKRLIELCEAAGRPVLPTCISPIVSPGRTVEEGARFISIQQLAEDFEPKFKVPMSGHYETLADFTGAAIAGPADEIIAGIRGHHKNGVDMVIFDLRLRFADWDECVQMIGEEVLPVLKREDGRAAQPATAAAKPA